MWEWTYTQMEAYNKMFEVLQTKKYTHEYFNSTSFQSKINYN